MFTVYRNISRITNKNSSIGVWSSIYITRNQSTVAENNHGFKQFKSQSVILSREFNKIANSYNLCSLIVAKRQFSKKKGSKRVVQEEEDSDTEEEYEENENVTGEDLDDSVITRTVSSLRLDAIFKAALGITKKKIEQEFYTFKLRINGRKVVKKAQSVHVGDEVDRVLGFSPDTNKYILVDRVIVKGISPITGSGTYPVKMEVFRQLTIENYDDPWDPSSLGELEK